jgi:hypothetical protein
VQTIKRGSRKPDRVGNINQSIKMKKIQLTVFLAIAAIGANAQIFNTQTTISPAISPLPYTRNTGIGTSSPQGGLHILGGIGRTTNSIFLLERKDALPSNQKNKLTVGISSNMFSAPPVLPAGSCAFMLDNPNSISSMAFSTNRISPQLLIRQNGNVGINTITPLHKLHVHNGGIMISGSTPGYGGPQLIFTDDPITTPNGRWAIEYISADPSSRPSMGGLNFWKPFPDAGGAGNYSLFLKDDGKIGMGVTDDNSDNKFCATALSGNYRLYVNGGILTTKIKVANYNPGSWPDYVFDNNYKLPQLSEVESFVKANKHLPGIPSAKEIEKEGLDLAEMQSKQMEKIEELTLYLIELKKDVEALKKENAVLKLSFSSLKD